MQTLHLPADDLVPRHQPPRSNQLAMATRTSGIDLFWLPLGAGGRSVRFIPDVVEAVGGPRHLRDDRGTARRLLELVPLVPTPVWGRDELRAGEMWNSNSVIAWLLAWSAAQPVTAEGSEFGRTGGRRRAGARSPTRRRSTVALRNAAARRLALPAALAEPISITCNPRRHACRGSAPLFTVSVGISVTSEATGQPIRAEPRPAALDSLAAGLVWGWRTRAVLRAA
jgi:hypothetical protein